NGVWRRALLVLKVALVTGAGGGIGRASSLALAREGFLVILAGRNEEKLKATAALVDGETIAVPADVTDPASVSSLFDTVRSRAGRLDVLFNNAGVDVPGVPFDEITFEVWNRIIGTNLTGQFLC